ncbi:MAG: type II secretion system protein GspC [Gammaproteobacteria bacterium]|nr:type II secretion system protein GspC [Gammaproteobacteria bacterium]
MKQFVQQILSRSQQVSHEMIAQWMSYALIMSIAYSGSLTTWTVIETVTSTTAYSPLITSPQPSSSGSAQSTPSVSQLNIFGDGQAPVNTGAPVNAPETRLNLQLSGVIASPDRQVARAFIVSSGSERSYRINESVPGGAVLKEIYSDRVILSRNGRFETLRMPIKTTWIISDDEKSASAPSASNKINPKVSREEVLKYKQILLSQPNELAGMIRQRPVRKNGQIQGFRIFPGKDRELFKRMGLQPGDVVTGVNGMPLSNTEAVMALYGKLPELSQLSIDIERRGSKMTLALPWN